METTRTWITDRPEIEAANKQTEPNLKHTPGPWNANLKVAYEWPTEEIEIMDQEGNGFIAKVYAYTNIETQTANARLIATSPMLLEACRGLLDMITDNRLHGSEVFFAADAIAAAEGGE